MLMTKILIVLFVVAMVGSRLPREAVGGHLGLPGHRGLPGLLLAIGTPKKLNLKMRWTRQRKLKETLFREINEREYVADIPLLEM